MSNVETNAASGGRIAVVLGLIGVALILLLFKGCIITAPWLGIHVGSWQGLRFLPFFGLLGLWGVIQIVLAVWVGIDAERRGSNGFLWGLLVLFTPIVGLLVYLILAPGLTRGAAPAPPGPGPDRPPAPPAKESQGAAATPAGRSCPQCAGPLEEGFKVCPFCGLALCCAQCGRPLRAEWRHCPHCGGAITRGGPSGAPA